LRGTWAMSSAGEVSFDFENSQVRLVALRKIPEVETAGLRIEETEAGRDLTVSLWIAWELIEAGLARMADEGVSGEEWTKIHYRERFQPLGQPSPLPDDFYSKAYAAFKREAKSVIGDPSRLKNLDRMKGWFRDILESRISRIVRLASAEASPQIRALQPEEAALYKELNAIVSSWRKEMRRLGEG